MKLDLLKYVLLKNGRILNTTDYTLSLSTESQGALMVVLAGGTVVGEFLCTAPDIDTIIRKRREYMERESKWLGEFVPGTKYVFCDPEDSNHRIYLVFEGMDDRKEEQNRVINSLIKIGYKMVSSTTQVR